MHRAINPELLSALERLRLGRISDTLVERLVLAEKQEMCFEDLLLLLLTDENTRRESSAAQRRANTAALGPKMRFELFDKAAKVSHDKKLLNEIASLRFMETQNHVVILGSVGVGKTFVATALGHVACQHGYNVKFVRADAMLRALRQSRFDNSRDATMLELITVELMIRDDFAIETMNKEQSNDVYQLFLERTGSASMIITSNRDTSEWLTVFDDMLLAQSAVDPFKNTAYDFIMDGESHRQRLKPKMAADDPPPKSPAFKSPRHPRSRRR